MNKSNARRRREGEDPRGPGAHSGREREPRERIIPGTATAAEGFTESDTARGDPLHGVVTEDAEADTKEK
ncbi:hypothetical protein [Streptomyces litchfieldiae]|uniref:Uncharacterized protein n=1 Tax=Streptomyces litchfieldiae TaxID=3075543 RepID=A0ABU2N055_9ACTN|nr:hypothetical protein [Streptomyces sp. DSM 44938]MDT0346903.1 hypothetical protein [Streptomyces sp. DSM 44938]